MSEYQVQAFASAIRVHRQLIEAGEVDERAVNEALWLLADTLAKKCNGSCCG